MRCFVPKFSFLILYIILIWSSVSAHSINNKHKHHSKSSHSKRVEILDPRYKLEWKANIEAKTIEFTVTASTTGYIGFGLSNLGSMSDADIVIAGVHDVDNTIYFGDYHGVGFSTPVLDDIQNWELVEGSQMNGNTTITFRRALDTCDLAQDLAITSGTIKVIWSLGSSDAIVQHAATSRGVLSMNLLDPAPPVIDLSQYPHEDIIIDYTLTPDDTVYWCTVHKRVSNSTSHIVAFNPHLPTETSRRHTHHYNMFICQGDNLEELLNPYVEAGGVNCLKPIPDYLPRVYCQMNLYARSLGGRTLVFPENVGYPWGGEDNTVEYFLFETHVDNPTKISGESFKTGVEIYHTTELRKHEAGRLWLGHSNGAAIMVPPDTADWTIAGHCSSYCLTKSITNGAINIFNSNLHSHMSGRKLKLRHFRDGTELPWIQNDESYDFDYQENRPLIQNRQVLPNDHITLECTYDSNWMSPNAVVGGLSTRDEMCMAFIYYYPKTDFGRCFSGYPIDKLLQRFGIEEFTTAILDPLIVKPDKWANMLYSDVLTNHTTWTQPMKDALMNELRFGPHSEDCATSTEFKNKKKADTSGTKVKTTKYPEFEKPYVEERGECLIITSGPSVFIIHNYLFFGIIFVILVSICTIYNATRDRTTIVYRPLSTK